MLEDETRVFGWIQFKTYKTAFLLPKGFKYNFDFELFKVSASGKSKVVQIEIQIIDETGEEISLILRFISMSSIELLKLIKLSLCGLKINE